LVARCLPDTPTCSQPIFTLRTASLPIRTSHPFAHQIRPCETAHRPPRPSASQGHPDTHPCWPLHIPHCHHSHKPSSRPQHHFCLQFSEILRKCLHSPSPLPLGTQTLLASPSYNSTSSSLPQTLRPAPAILPSLLPLAACHWQCQLCCRSGDPVADDPVACGTASRMTMP
jgi:hypothetical protein